MPEHSMLHVVNIRVPELTNNLPGVWGDRL